MGPEGLLQQVPELRPPALLRNAEPRTPSGRAGQGRLAAPRGRGGFPQGLSPSLLRQAWRSLLWYFSWEGSAKDSKAHVRKKADEDFHLKLPWKSVRPGQGQRNSPPHGYRSLTARDESRSHRTNKFSEGRENPGLGLLNDVLLPDCLYHDELGYVQGRSDLLFPIR